MNKSMAIGMVLAAACLTLGVARAEFAWGESAWVSAGRVDCRSDFGGRLVHGMERMGNADGGAAEAWDTTKLTDGWQEVARGTNRTEVAVLNGPGVGVEFGRLAEDATWGSDKVHVVRDWVAVPEGVRLEIGEGTVVKFTRGTGILVEKGGTLRLSGAREAPVKLTSAADDGVGGDTDLREEAPEGCWFVDARGTVEDTGWTDFGYVDTAQSGRMALSGMRVGLGRLEEGREARSGRVRVDGRAARTGAGARLTMGDEWATWNTAWDGAAKVAVTLERPDGERKTLGEATGTGPGEADWKAEEEGRYRVEYSATDGEGAVLKEQAVEFVKLGDEVVVHSGGVGHNETWEAGKIHVVDGKVSVGYGEELRIENGAVVKFTGGSSLVVSGGGTCVANSVVFTHINDDAVGGDTMMDGNATGPVADAYRIVGEMATDGATQMRYLTESVSGTLEGANEWGKGRVIRVTGNVTVANGATLTVLPGTIVKFDTGVSLTVNSGGTLNAIGTRAQPIVFTSVKDDEHGGDTNGDGAATVAQAGDWKKIAVYGTAAFEFAKVRYASSGTGTDDAILVSEGSVTFNNSELAFGQMYAVGVESGHFYATNSVIREFYCAFRHWPYDPFVNGVIYNCNRLSNNNGQKFYNTVIAGVTEAWDWSSGSGNTYGHCLFWNEQGMGLQGLPGSASPGDGNVWGNPLFVDADAGNFRVAEGSPCVDAGDTAVAPEMDLYGQPRVSAWGEAVADIGVYEVQPRGVAGDVDLVPVKVSADGEATPGGKLAVKWTVGNRGGKATDTVRRDTVSLVSATGRTVALGDVVVSRSVAAGGTVECSGSFTVPAMAEGTWYPKVVVNSYQDVFEGSLVANNALTGTDGVEVSVAATDPVAGASGTVAAGVPMVLKLGFGTGDENRMVVLNVPAGMSVSWGFGFVPTVGGTSGISGMGGTPGASGATGTSGTTEADGTPVQFVAPEDAETVYVVMESGTDATYTLTTESAKVAVTGVEPAEVPSSGNATLAISGAGFTAGSAVRLVGNGATIEVDSVRVVDTRTISATVDCGKLSAGTSYDVEVEAVGGTVTAANAVRVAAAPGEGKFWARLVVPDSVREGRKVACSIEYGNSGNADMDAPVLQVAMNGTGTLGYVDGLQGLKTLQFVAAGNAGSAGVLRPGSEQRIQFELVAGNSNRMTLHASVGSTYAPEPWERAEEYLADLSAAVTRTGLRGRDATDYKQVLALARAVKNGECVGVIHGTLVNLHGEKISGGSLVWSEIETTNSVLATVDSCGHFVTPPLPAGKWTVVSMDGGRIVSDAISLEKDDDEDISVASLVVDDSLSAKIWVSGMKEGTLIPVCATLAGSDIVVSSAVDDNGVALFRGLEKGIWRFSAELDGKSGVTYAEIADGVSAMEGTIILTDSVSISGRVNLSKWSGASGVCFIPEEGAPILVQIDGTGYYETLLPKGFYIAAPLGILNDDAWIECDIAEACTIDFDQNGVVASAKTKAANAMRDNGDRYDLWFWQVRGEAKKRYDEALRLIGATTPIAPPPNDARCIHNLERYLQYRQESINFANESVAFISAYGGTDPYKMIAYISKSIGDGASVAAAFYSRAKANMALRNWHKYAGGIYNLRAAVAGGAVNFTASQLKELTSEVDNLEMALSDLKSMLENPVLSMEWVRALNATTGRIQSLLSSIDLMMASVNLLSGGATGQITGVVSAALSVAECVTDLILAFDAGMDWWDGISRMRALLPVFDRSINRYKNESASFGIYDLHCCNEPLPDDVWKDIIDRFAPSVPHALDPNEMAGPLGTGTARYVAPGEEMLYTVYFENKSDATAAAQEVYVTEQLSGALDWSTFEVVDVGFNNQIDLGLGGKRKGASETAMTGTAYKVRTTLDYIEKTGAAKWYMRIVDEATETRWPKDVFAGFLPPNDETGRGEGHITYRVKVREDAVAGTVIRASASIVFDYNAAIETDPAWWNTVAEMGTATVDLGNGVSTNVTVMVGAPWGGQLPDPGKRQGMRFVGWFTGPNGTGEEVTAESLVAAGAKLYAFWDASAAVELWLDVSWGAVEIGTNGVEKGYAPDGNSVEGSANRYVLTGTSKVYGVKFAGGSFTNTWTNLVIDLNVKDAVAIVLEGANVEVEVAGDNSVASGEDCAGIRVDAKSALTLQGTGRLVARGGKCGAGIGGGKLQESGRVEIRAGAVEACGGEYGAGIGGGLVAPAAEAVVITGGSVKARGSDGGEDIGGGFGREGTGVPVGAAGTAVHEVEVPLATDTLPAEVVVDLGSGKTYRYEGAGHVEDTSLYFWLPDGTYEFTADGDDYGAHVEGDGTAALFTDPGSTHFVAPPLGEVGTDADGSMRAAMNPAYRTSPFEVWSATGLDGAAWNWNLLPANAYTYDATNAIIRIPNDTNQMRLLRFQFLPRRQYASQ